MGGSLAALLIGDPKGGQQLLKGIRVLDLSNPRAELTGRILAELGAEVLKVEPPSGCKARRLPPFDETDDTKKSLYWSTVGLGKHSAVLDLEAELDLSCLLELVRRADILIESDQPGYMASVGLAYETLRNLNPRLIYVSVTPYGSEGPKAHWPATELTLEAAGGRVSLQGDRDRPPLPIGYPQTAFHAAARAAADAIIALNERALSGLGQHLDTSMLEAVVVGLMNGPGYPSYVHADPPGTGDDRADPPAPQRGVLLGRCDCADGYVVVTNTSQAQLLKAIPSSVLPVLATSGGVPSSLENVDWERLPSELREGKAAPETLSAAIEAVRAFFRLKSKKELMEWAWEHDVHLGPVNTTADLLQISHFQERGFWQKIGSYVQPGPPVRASRTPIRYTRPAPELGQDKQLIAEWLAEPPLPTNLPTPGDRLGEAFAGLKVADFSWVAVGPITAKALADHGATVVRVESSTRVDFVRTLTPFKDGEPGINRSHFMNNLNSSKLGIALNLATEDGKKLARQLADWADVIVENFTPGTMKRLGLDYETLSLNHPDLIMVSTCLMGQTGPWASFAGYGPHGSAMSGIYGLTGWPDRPPTGPSGPYTDVIAPHYAISAMAAAIYERRSTGLGQHIDVSQVEAAIHFIEPLVLDQIVNGRTAGPAGLHSATAGPHGIYRTLGTERYIAIAVETAAQWRALKSVAPLAEFDHAHFDDLAARVAAREGIDATLSAWTATQDRRELEKTLTGAGVPAAVVQRMTELHEDPQLAARHYFVPLEHSEVGLIPFDGLITHFSAKQRMLHKAAPCVGEDTDYVLRELLGIDPVQIAEYAAAGVLV